MIVYDLTSSVIKFISGTCSNFKFDKNKMTYFDCLVHGHKKKHISLDLICVRGEYVFCLF